MKAAAVLCVGLAVLAMAVAAEGSLSLKQQGQVLAKTRELLGAAADAQERLSQANELRRRQDPAAMTCADLKCASTGQLCGISGGSYYFCNVLTDYCNSSATTPVCVKKPVIQNGEECDLGGPGDCAPGLRCNYTASPPTCAPDTLNDPNLLQGGQCCGLVGSRQCETGATCSGNRCPFTANGQSCTSSSECKYDSYCSISGVCTARPLTGTCGTEIDEDAPSICGGGEIIAFSTCQNNSDVFTCEEINFLNRKANGQPCDDPFDCDSWFCSTATGLCTAVPAPPTPVTCNAPLNVSDSVCPTPGGRCFCNSPTTGECIDTDFFGGDMMSRILQACENQVLALLQCKPSNPDCPIGWDNGECCCDKFYDYAQCFVAEFDKVFPSYDYAPFCAPGANFFSTGFFPTAKCTAVGTACGTCVPRTCGVDDCGPVSDGCGGPDLDCGGCTAFNNSYCNPSTSKCACNKETCATLGYTCNPSAIADDLCGGSINANACGSCLTGENCQSNNCQNASCTNPPSCAGRQCGTVAGTPPCKSISCGECNSITETCNVGTGQCEAQTCSSCPSNFECGSFVNSCGRVVSCGPACQTGFTCLGTQSGGKVCASAGTSASQSTSGAEQFMASAFGVTVAMMLALFA